MPDSLPSPHGLLDLLPVSVARVGPDLRFTWCNSRLCQQLHRTADDIIGRTSLDLGMTPASWGDWTAAVARVFDTGQPSHQYHLCHMSAGERLISTRFAPIPGPDGRPAAVVAVAFVDDEVRHLRTSLSLSEQRFQAFMDHVPAIAWLRDADERYLFVNREYERLQRVTAADRLGKHPSEVFPPEVAARLLANDKLAEAGPVRTEERVPDGEGVMRSWLNVKFTFPGPDGRWQYAGFGVDLTAEAGREAERQALRAKLLIAQRAESLGVLAGGVAHDFNNLLSAVLGYAGLAQAQTTAGPLADCLTQIEVAATRAAELCRQMLDYARDGPPIRQPVHLPVLVRETVRLLTAVHLRGVTVKLDLPADLPPVTGDPTQLRQVVLNLLTNAAEATLGRPTRVVVVAAETTADAVRLTVRDTGPGIAPEAAGRLFEPFFTTKPTGRGLGLAAVDEIVRGHGGSVRAESPAGGGAEFVIDLPT